MTEKKEREYIVKGKDIPKLIKELINDLVVEYYEKGLKEGLKLREQEVKKKID